MEKKDTAAIKVIIKEFMNGYWGVGDVIKCASMLFPIVNPEQKVRDAVKAMSCKKDKDNRFSESRRSIKTGTDYHFLRELEQMMQRESMRYEKEFLEERGRRDYRDMLMILVPVLAAQKSNISINLDVNQLNQTIYGECKECPIREICKEALPIATEYVSFVLKEVGFETLTKEK